MDPVLVVAVLESLSAVYLAYGVVGRHSEAAEAASLGKMPADELSFGDSWWQAIRGTSLKIEML
jgi:hypothetical protein